MSTPESPLTTCQWNFFGPRSQGIAEHFLQHIGEFLTNNQLPSGTSWVESINSNHHQANLRIETIYKDQLAKALKPHSFV